MSKTDNNNKMYINSNGQRVLRVSEVIKILAKDQIATWANMLGFKGIDYKKELNRTANVGTLVHAFIEDYVDPKMIPIIDYDEYKVFGFQSQQEADNAIASFIDWYQGIQDRYHVKFTEKQIVGEMLGGTVDCGIDGFEDPEKVIFVDYKTSGQFYLTQFLQLSGYVKIYEELYGKDTVEGVMVILCDKKSGHRARAKLIKRNELNPLITCFDCMLNTAIATRILNKGWWRLGKEVV